MLSLDSLVIDLMFRAGSPVDPQALVAALGGEAGAAQRKLLDPDMQDPRFEMELSPSMPFRRRGERRLLLIDDSVAPMREDPHTDFLVPLDLRPERDRLIAICESQPIRLARISALGSWGDAVLIAESAVDLRAIALLSWVLDPSVDVDGKRRAGRLSQAEFEAKIAAYDRRLEELPESEILAGIHGARVERRGDYIVVDVLEDDGTWDLRRSLALEHDLAAIDRFSLLPGAPAGSAPPPGGEPAARPGARPEPEPEPEPEIEPEPDIPPLRVADLDGRVLLIFPPDRFDNQVAAALGKRDYTAVLTRQDPIPGPTRDAIYRHGAEFLAPLEFLSEVFLDGKPLSRPEFERHATTRAGGVRTLDVHCPRFGPAILLDIPDRGRFLSSARDQPDRLGELLSR